MDFLHIIEPSDLTVVGEGGFHENGICYVD